MVRAGNHNLSMLMAYQLASNWHGRIRLMMTVRDSDSLSKAKAYLQELVDLARLPTSTEIVVMDDPFMDALQSSPRADLNIFGLSLQPDLALSQQIAKRIDASCIFVRDSGEESAFA